MFKRNIIIAYCTVMLGLTTLINLNNVNAFIAHNYQKNHNITLENMKWSNNLYPSYKLDNWNLYKGFNGDVESANGKVLMTFNGTEPSYNHMFPLKLGYLYDWQNHGFTMQNSIYMNKTIANNVGIGIDGESTYMISYHIEGEKLEKSDVVLFWTDENYYCNDWDATKYQNSFFGNDVKYVFKMPDSAKYFSFRIDPHLKNPIKGDTATISNISIHKLIK